MVKYKFRVDITGYIDADPEENVNELLEDFKQNIYDVDITHVNIVDIKSVDDYGHVTW